MTESRLVNCKKCGTLFFKSSAREICDECFKKELKTIEDIENYVLSSKKEKVTIEEISNNVDISIADIEDLISRGKLVSILAKLSVRCRFCGAELEINEKTGFTCKRCLIKFSPQASEFEKKGFNLRRNEEEAKKMDRRLRGGMREANQDTARYGFIQNYDL